MRQKRGVYFHPLPFSRHKKRTFNQVKDALPAPITDRGDLLALFWYAVELAFENARTPKKDTPLVAPFQDSAFNDNLFLWDSAFITRFLSVFDGFLPGIVTLDNFYAMQLEDGLIPREFNKHTGEDFKPWVNHDALPLHSVFHHHYQYRGLDPDADFDTLYFPNLGRDVGDPPHYTLDNLNHPILAYAEYHHYLHTKDEARLKRVHGALFKHYTGLKHHLRHASGLYVTDWASMDNSPRNKTLFLGVDISSEMGLFADMMVRIYEVIGKEDFAERVDFFKEEKRVLKRLINARMWHEKDRFYYDLDADMNPIVIKTIAGFWPLLSGISEPWMNKALIEQLENPNTFNRLNRVPSLAADEPAFHPDGGYWSGAVWAPTNLMVTDGLELIGEREKARAIALQYLDVVSLVFKKTGTIWETYPADHATQGDSDRGRFVGWSGIGPVLYFLQYHIGLHADAREEVLSWTLDALQSELGCRQYRFFGREADLLAEKTNTGIRISIKTNDTFRLKTVLDKHVRTFWVDGDSEFWIDDNA